VNVYLREEGSPIPTDGSLTKNIRDLDKNKSNKVLSGINNGLVNGSLAVICESCPGLQIGAIALHNTACKEKIDLMALAAKNGGAFGNDSFNIFSPMVERWKNR
jgi:hypothetical protein